MSPSKAALALCLIAALAMAVIAQYPPAPGSGGKKCSIDAQVCSLDPSFSLSLSLSHFSLWSQCAAFSLLLFLLSLPLYAFV